MSTVESLFRRVTGGNTNKSGKGYSNDNNQRRTILGFEPDSEEESFIKKTKASLNASLLKRHPWFDCELAWYNHFAVGSYWFGWAFLWMPLLVVVIPHQVEKIVGTDIQGSSMGSVFLAGSISSVILAPMFGHMSDCSQNAMGRRRPFIVVGVMVTTLGLFVMMLSPPFVIYCAGFFIASAGNHIALSPYAALVPDVIPHDQRGICSGWLGACSMFGYLLGGALSYHLEKLGIVFTYISLAILHIFFAWITVRFVPEIPNVYYPLTSDSPLDLDDRLPSSKLTLENHNSSSLNEQPSSKVDLTATMNNTSNSKSKAHLSDSDSDALSHKLFKNQKKPNLGVTRTTADDMCCTQCFGVDPSSNQPRCLWLHNLFVNLRKQKEIDRENLQFYLKDTTKNGYNFFGYQLAENETQAVSVLFAPLLFGGLISSIVSGIVSDLYDQKRKFLVYFSGSLMTVCCLSFGMNHIFTLDIFISLFFGFGFGVFSAIDWAMATDVLPNPKCYGRDMGMWNLSLTLPQMIGAPLVGFVVDAFRSWNHIFLGWFFVFLISAISFIIGTVLVKKIAHVK